MTDARMKTALVVLTFGAALLAVGEQAARTGEAAAPPRRGKVYVSNTDSRTVSVIDLATLTETRTIPTGREPRGCDLNPAGTLLFVPNRFSADVTVISTSADSVLTTIALTGSEPYNLAVSPDGSRVYVVCKSSSTLNVIDTSTMAEIASVPLSSSNASPEGVAVSPDGLRVYVANRRADTMDVIDTNTNTIVASAIPVVNAPRDAKVSADGSKVLIVGEGGPTVLRTSDNSTFDFPPLGDQRDVDIVGSTAYATALSGRVDIYNLATETFVRSINLPASRTPYALAVTDDETCILIADVDDDTLRVVDLPADIEREGPVTVGRGPRGIALLEDVNAAPAGTIRSFLLPKTISVRLSPAKRGKPGVKSKGTFDTGPDLVDLTAPATILVGPRQFDVPGLTPVKGGKSFVFEGDGLVFQVTPSKLGTSKAKYNLTFSGDLGEGADLNGEFTLSYVGGGVDAQATVILANGAFKFGRAPGTLIAPAISIRKAKAKLPGVGRHSFKFVAGIAGDGSAPNTAPDVRVAFGDIFSADVPAEALSLKGKNFVLTGAVADGVQAISLNYAKERISVRGGDVDLGNVPEGPIPLLLIYEQGDDVRAVFVRGARRNKILKY